MVVIKVLKKVSNYRTSPLFGLACSSRLRRLYRRHIRVHSVHAVLALPQTKVPTCPIYTRKQLPPTPRGVSNSMRRCGHSFIGKTFRREQFPLSARPRNPISIPALHYCKAPYPACPHYPMLVIFSGHGCSSTEMMQSAFELESKAAQSSAGATKLGIKLLELVFYPPNNRNTFHLRGPQSQRCSLPPLFQILDPLLLTGGASSAEASLPASAKARIPHRLPHLLTIESQTLCQSLRKSQYNPHRKH